MYNAFTNWLCGFEGDKYVHVIICQVIAFVISCALSPFFGMYAVLIAFPATAAIGFFKEIKDDFFDYDDFKADLIGAVMGIGLFLLSRFCM